MDKIIKSFQYGECECTLETGRIARQADAAVLISMGDTVLLATVVAKKELTEGCDFFPLTVNYQEKSYAVGKIPGGYFKREGRPTEKEILISRLIDRSIRPLFPKGFSNEVQVIVTLLSLDPEISSDVPAVIATSAALSISGIPFNGPLGVACVGYLNGEYLLNPSFLQLEDSKLNLTVAGTENAVLMVESEADQISENVMLAAVIYGHEKMKIVIEAIKEFTNKAGKTPWNWKAPEINPIFVMQMQKKYKLSLSAAYKLTNKQESLESIASIREKVVAEMTTEKYEEGKQPTKDEVLSLFDDLERNIIRENILSGEYRIDGRSTEDIRDISMQVGFLPRTHGSAEFTRGNTQALVTCTLGTERDGQIVDALEKPYREYFILHYNFPPYCVGELGFISSPKRREVGHGKLAKRALQAIIPSLETFPYVLCIVSEITESNGSSSMASVCGASMALMDAGVPIKAPVAGIAMGLIKKDEKYAILSDILGKEDHLGDMDFKVAGTQEGITALQMDIKIEGITKEIMKNALEQAKTGRLHILNAMLGVIEIPRIDISKHAPRIVTININPDKIRDVIGKGGVMIRELTEKTNSTIDITDDGVVKISALNSENLAEVVRRIEVLTAEVEIGKIYDGKVVKIVDFGAFVEVLPGRQGLVHISQITQEHVNNVRDFLEENQNIRVKVIDIDRQGRVRLSMKELDVV